MTDQTTIEALVEIQRTQIILAKKSSGTSKLIPDSYAFAIDKRLCPIFHTDAASPFDAGYKIKRAFADDVVMYCDKKWVAKESLSFYDLEAHFGGQRWELIRILRYAALDRRFDDQFFVGIDSNCPTEAHGINDSFDVNEIGIV